MDEPKTQYQIVWHNLYPIFEIFSQIIQVLTFVFINSIF